MNKIITTQDGSHSILSGQFGEAYHSKYGAIQESQHVFIQAGLKHFIESQQNTNIKIFEMGLGTGLNAFLTWRFLQNQNIEIEYTGVEAFPISKWQELNFAKNEEEQTVFNNIHQAAWETLTPITEHFKIKKIKASLLEHSFPKNAYNLVYYDAFAPNAQPELWTEATFGKVFEMLDTDGILTSYCAKGSVKRALKAVGFKVESIPGPPGKREMTRAVKI